MLHPHQRDIEAELGEPVGETHEKSGRCRDAELVRREQPRQYDERRNVDQLVESLLAQAPQDTPLGDRPIGSPLRQPQRRHGVTHVRPR